MAAASSRQNQASPFSPAGGSDQFNHLRFLNQNDQQVLCRSECAAALKEEAKTIKQFEATIDAHIRATEHCRAASEADPDWFTLDVQDCHSRRVMILRDALAALQAEAPPEAEDVGIADAIRGRIYSSYSKTAQTTQRTAAGLLESDQVQRFAQQGQVAAAMASSAIGSIIQQVDAGIGRITDAHSGDADAEDEPGLYVITHNGTVVGPDLTLGREITKLSMGKVVHVVEVVAVPTDKRIRGRIMDPAGWISLKNLEDGYRFAQKQDENTPVTIEVREGHDLYIPADAMILSAWYGSKNRKSDVRDRLQPGTAVRVGNQALGPDPAWLVPKKLVVVWQKDHNFSTATSSRSGLHPSVSSSSGGGVAASSRGMPADAPPAEECVLQQPMFKGDETPDSSKFIKDAKAGMNHVHRTSIHGDAQVSNQVAALASESEAGGVDPAASPESQASAEVSNQVAALASESEARAVAPAPNPESPQADLLDLGY